MILALRKEAEEPDFLWDKKVTEALKSYIWVTESKKSYRRGYSGEQS